MNERDTKRFIQLREALLEEKQDLETYMAGLNQQIEDADRRWTEIDELLNGSIEGETDLPVESPKDEQPVSDLDANILTFLRMQNGASKRVIANAFSDTITDAPYVIDKAVKRLTRRGLIRREGTTANSTWHVA